MKRLIPLLFLVYTAANAQSINQLKLDAKKLYQANYLMDFEAIAELTYPKITEEIGKEALLEKIEKHYENDEYRMRLQLEMVPFKYGEIKIIEGKSLCVISCSNPMRYTFNDKLSKDDADSKTQWIMGIKRTISAIFEPARNSFNVKRTTIFVAVSDATTNNQWKFINLDYGFQQDIFDSIFGESIKKELGL